MEHARAAAVAEARSAQGTAQMMGRGHTSSQQHGGAAGAARTSAAEAGPTDTALEEDLRGTQAGALVETERDRQIRLVHAVCLYRKCYKKLVIPLG